jgi:hypothetical protein
MARAVRCTRGRKRSCNSPASGADLRVRRRPLPNRQLISPPDAVLEILLSVAEHRSRLPFHVARSRTRGDRLHHLLCVSAWLRADSGWTGACADRLFGFIYYCRSVRAKQPVDPGAGSGSGDSRAQHAEAKPRPRCVRVETRMAPCFCGCRAIHAPAHRLARLAETLAHFRSQLADASRSGDGRSRSTGTTVGAPLASA